MQPAHGVSQTNQIGLNGGNLFNAEGIDFSHFLFGCKALDALVEGIVAVVPIVNAGACRH